MYIYIHIVYAHTSTHTNLEIKLIKRNVVEVKQGLVGILKHQILAESGGAVGAARRRQLHET